MGNAMRAYILGLVAALALVSMQVGLPHAQAAANITSIFSNDYRNFMATNNLTVRYKMNFNTGVSGIGLWALNPSLTIYKAGSKGRTDITVNVFLQSYTASFYEVNNTVLFCLTTNSFFFGSTSNCGLIGDLSKSGINPLYINFTNQKFDGISYLGSRTVNGNQCDEVSGRYSGELINQLLSKVGLNGGSNAYIRACFNKQYGYVQQVNVSTGNYQVSLTGSNPSTTPIRPSTFVPPVKFVADWFTCRNASISFSYIPMATSYNTTITISAKSSRLAGMTFPGALDAFHVYNLNLTASRGVGNGESLSVCSGGVCYPVQCT